MVWGWVVEKLGFGELGRPLYGLYTESPHVPAPDCSHMALSGCGDRGPENQDLLWLSSTAQAFTFHFFWETHSPSKLFVLGNIIKETSELVQYCSDFTIWSGLKIMLYSLTSCLLSALWVCSIVQEPGEEVLPSGTPAPGAGEGVRPLLKERSPPPGLPSMEEACLYVTSVGLWSCKCLSSVEMGPTISAVNWLYW